MGAQEPSENNTNAVQGGAGKTVARRSTLKGAAWAVPAISVATAAPSVAASAGGKFIPVSKTVTATKWKMATSTIVIPAGSRNITYEIVGGGGGTYDSLSYGPAGGSGAKITGTLSLTCSTGITLWAVAGGGGYGTSSSGVDPVNATGYGNGGYSKSVPIPSNLLANKGQAWCMGGGAGSALALNAAPNAGGTLLTVAGGGGSAAVTWHSYMDSTNWAYASKTGGSGGSADGGAGQTMVVNYSPGSITGAPGQGASGATGGAGGAGSSTTVSGYYLFKELAGAAGGNNGTGNLGGGNGANPVMLAVSDAGGMNKLSIASSAGGGGYAGGGSGSASAVGHTALVNGRTNAIGGIGAAGGAGSNYVAPMAACVTNTVLTQGQAGNGGVVSSTSPDTTGNGGPGYVKVSWEQPA